MGATRHFGLCCIQGTGHLLPMAAIGRALRARGHRVSCFQDARARAMIKAAGLEWQPIGLSRDVRAVYDGNVNGATRHVAPTPILMARHASAILAEGCEAVARAGVDALIVDQGDLASGSVAERLGLPFVSVSFFPPLLLDTEVPPPIVRWDARDGARARMWNWAANRVLTAALAPITRMVNDRRREWGLRPLASLNDFSSSRALIAQLPECLDFPRRRKPAHLYYAGPFLDEAGRYPMDFPWDALNGAPLVYASMGTVRNTWPMVFQQIAGACEGLPVQLVIALGGGLEPDAVGELPGHPIVVHFAPQLALLRRAAVTITHGGMNTTLESLLNGVPLVALPVTDDQPGVGARIVRAGAGLAIPIRKLTTARLRRALLAVLTEPQYRAAALRIRDRLRGLDGARRAAEIIESVCV
jgi:zeaxanthin glucosyltransferase